MRFYVEGLCFPSLEGVFVVFDSIQLMSFRNDCEKTSFQLFWSLCVFPKHSFDRSAPSFSKLISGSEKVVLRAGTYSDTIFQK